MALEELRELVKGVDDTDENRCEVEGDDVWL